jgi:hypothetical protein
MIVVSNHVGSVGRPVIFRCGARKWKRSTKLKGGHESKKRRRPQLSGKFRDEGFHFIALPFSFNKIFDDGNELQVLSDL